MNINRIPRVAFITTPKYRNEPKNRKSIDNFIRNSLSKLCNICEVISTGGTYDFILDRIEHSSDELSIIKEKLKEEKKAEIGMINITKKLVEGGIDAVIHLWHADDIIGKPDSMVLRREANVFNIPIFTDSHSASVAIKGWLKKTQKNEEILSYDEENETLLKYKNKISPTVALTEHQNNIAFVAHNKMKMDLCCLWIEKAKNVLEKYDNILATGTTGKWLKKFSKAMGIDEDKVILCNSGPYGGDVQIASAVVGGVCGTVVFLQDPHTSHPHESDIKLFEQSVLLFKQASINTDFILATNLTTAKSIIDESDKCIYTD